MTALADMTNQELMALEKQIAARFMGGVPWGSVAWGLGNLSVWISLWPLTFMGIMPIWLAFPIAVFNVMLSYLPSHEAQHRIIAKPGERFFWLNELVGTLSTIPLVAPYSALRLTHYEHHKYANHPELDPDFGTTAKGAWHAIWRSVQGRQPGAQATEGYIVALTRLNTPDANKAGLIALVWQLIYLTIIIVGSWNGYAIEMALLWWLPRHIGYTYIQYYLSWAPHHPGKQLGRYKDTRAFKSFFGNLGSMGMQFHIVHHLYPRIPLMRTPAAYWALRPVLEARGCDLEKM